MSTVDVRSTILGAGIGAGLMFLLDPARGARCRALVRDKLTRTSRTTRDAYAATRRDVGNRLSGAAAEVHARIQPDTADDRTIAARVRARLGRVCSHPRAIQVRSANGVVTLSGDVLAADVDAVERAVSRVRGVADIRNQLTVHDGDEGVPALQGRSPRPGRWSSWIAGSWSPTSMVLAGVGAAASVVAAAGSRRG
jgi:hypothetical protein